MGYHIIEVYAWVCDSCGMEAIHAGDGMPEGWVLASPPTGPLPAEGIHTCPVCFEKEFSDGAA